VQPKPLLPPPKLSLQFSSFSQNGAHAFVLGTVLFLSVLNPLP
jgi:hypothetical protein